MLKNLQIIFLKYLLSFLFWSLTLCVYGQSYGLKFNGYQSVLEERTELNLTPNDFISFDDEFELSFDFKLDDIEAETFGYVFRIVSKEGKNIDLITNVNPDERLNLVIGQSAKIQTIRSFNQYDDHWVHIRTKFLLQEDKLVFYTPDSFYVFNEIGFETNDQFKIFFGANDYGQFKNTDVPAMNIKNIKIFEDGKLSHYWPLDQEEGVVVKDRIGGHSAAVANPVWLKLAHQSWTKEIEKDYSGYVSVYYNEKYESLFVLGLDHCDIYSIEQKEWISIPYKNKPNFLKFNEKSDYRVIYNPDKEIVFCYTTDYGWPVYWLNLKTQLWNSTGILLDQYTKYRHHTHFYDDSSNSVLLFGGYGEHSYSNTVTQIDLNNGLKTVLPSNDTVFYPRYLAGSFSLNDTVYILGGYGSHSGNQLINPHSYYDLLAYDVARGIFTKKFDLAEVPDDMVVASNMWVDPLTRSYYGLIYEKSLYEGYLQLVSGNLDNNNIIKLGDRLPFLFHDMRSNSGLFYSQNHNKLLAYTSYTDKQGSTKLAMYSISYPPSEYIAPEAEEGHYSKLLWLMIIVGIGIVSSTVAWLFKYFKDNRIKESNDNAFFEVEKLATPEVKEEMLQKDNIEQDFIERQKYQVILFGGFQVFDDEFNDITNKFSPLLKELFLLVFLYTHKNNKGISSEKITEILWYDKSERSARNNRSVNMAKLRIILSELGGWQLSKKTGYWKILHGENDIKCDYLEYIDITDSYTNLNKERIMRLMQISEQGSFLYNLQYEWLDDFKASVSGKIIDALITFGNECKVEKDPEFIVKLAESVFNCDMVNEEAMTLKCKAEHFMGKHSMAKASYEKFCKEYKFMYGQEYDIPFINVINGHD